MAEILPLEENLSQRGARQPRAPAPFEAEARSACSETCRCAHWLDKRTWLGCERPSIRRHIVTLSFREWLLFCPRKHPPRACRLDSACCPSGAESLPAWPYARFSWPGLPAVFHLEINFPGFPACLLCLRRMCVGLTPKHTNTHPFGLGPNRSVRNIREIHAMDQLARSG